jgi:DNA repair ATPase RecN
MQSPEHPSHLAFSTSLIFQKDEVFASLNRQATDAKDKNDWALAVALLKQAKARQGQMYQDTRLAAFLQQAGQFDEAMAEFEWLLDRVPEQCKTLAGFNSPTYQYSCVIRRYETIHNAIRIAAKRAKRVDLVEKHQAMVDTYQSEAEKLEKILERERKAEIKAYDAI